MASYFLFSPLFLLKLLLKLLFLLLHFSLYVLYFFFFIISGGWVRGEVSRIREQPWNTCMICVEGGRGKGVLLLLHLARQPYESIVFIFAAARSPSGHSSGAGQTSNFSFQNIRLKAESINMKRMNYATTHGTRVCRSLSFRNMTSREKLRQNRGGQTA